MSAFAHSLFPLPRVCRLLLGAAVTCVPLVAAAQQTDDQKVEEHSAADIPIRRVVMFSSGVAFFEHGGEVEGNAEVEFKFNVKDINDLLKSMVLQDEGGGRISTVSYASKDPITRTLSTFSIDLTDNPTLADLLQQIRGEAIEIDAPNKVTGIILGVEKRKVPAGKDSDEVIEVPHLNLLTDEGLRSVSLESVGRLKLQNERLNAELRQALSILAAAKSQDKKAVTLNFLGAGRRPVRVGYIQEAPIWKTSYRLVLDDEDPPFLQGWAIVENTTESDWNDVNLTLVSGRPISFVMDLYEPLYVDRPEVKPELYASLRPRTYDQDLAKAEAEFREAAAPESAPQSGREVARRGRATFAAPPTPAQESRASGGAAGYSAGGLGAGVPLEAERLNLQQGVQSVAQAADVGELFRYQIATPVKLERGKSAMLPIVNQSVEGDKVSIYNEATHAKYPLNGLKLKNTTDLHLMQGPITVFDGGAYAGDAQIQDLPPGSERLISYALDLNTEVAPSQKQEPAKLVNVRLSKGTLFTSLKNTRTKSYLAKNSGDEAKTLLIEHPIQQPWQLVEPEEPAEKTRSHYRFSVTAEPGKPQTLDVREEYTQQVQIVLTNLDDDRIQYYLQAPQVSEAVKDALRELVKRRAAIQNVAASRQEMERQISVIEQEQSRIRQNMQQLPRDSDLYRRYVTKFTEQEDQIEKLRGQVTAAVEEEQNLNKALNEYLMGLELS